MAATAKHTQLSPLPAVLLVGLYLANSALALGWQPATIPAVTQRELTWWGVAAVVVITVLRLERLPPGVIGVKRVGWRSLATAGAGFIAAFAAAGLMTGLILPALGFGPPAAGVARMAALPAALQMMIFVRAGVVEELVCRGLVIERVLALGGSRMTAAAASLLVFAVPHAFSWELHQLAFVIPVGAVFVCLYLWKRDVVACMIAHTLVDAAGFALAAMPHG